MQGLIHLEEIHIGECDSLQAIITYDAGKVEVAADDMVKLPNVRCLDLQWLPNMTSFCTGVNGAPIQVLLPWLECLVMAGLFGLEKILYSEPSLKYSNLKCLEIKESKSTSIIPKDWILKLPNLGSMGIVRSPSAEVVFDLEELKVARDAEILSWLMQLELSELPNLQRMCKQDGQLQRISIFRNLKRLFIKNIGLSFLFTVSMAKCLREIRDIEVDGCPNMKAVIVDEEGTYDARDDIIEFPLLEQLSISHCPIEKFFSYPHGKKESITTTSDSQDNYPHSFFDQKISLPNLEELIFRSGSFKSIWHSELPKSSFDKLANLTLKQDLQSQGISFLFSMSMAKRLREIRDIEVEDCPNMKAVIVDEEGTDDRRDDIIEFPLLERLSISRCPMAKFFSYPHGKKESITTTSDSQDNYPHSFFDQKISLPNMEELILRSVGSRLSCLFLVSMAKCLREIRDIEVEDCPNMKAVIVDEEGTDDGRDDIIEFPLLERLSVSCCPMEKFFSYLHGKKESITTTSDSQDNYSHSFFDQKISLPSLEKLVIKSVGLLKRIWHSELPKSSFDKLANLTLKKCSNLLDVFPSTIMGRLHNLEIVKVSGCPSLESLFDFGSLDSYTEQTIVLLPKLEEIMVLSCPSLKSLFNWGPLDSSIEHKIVLLPKLEGVAVSGAGRLRHVVMSDSQTVLGFPSLKLVFVYNCSELRYLFPNYMATNLAKLNILVVSKCEQMKEVVPKEEGGRSKAEVMSFHSLTSLVIWRCPNFREFIPTSAERQLGKMIEENDEFPSVDVSSRTELDQGNRSAEESEGEIEDLDLRIEELECEIEEE